MANGTDSHEYDKQSNSLCAIVSFETGVCAIAKSGHRLRAYQHVSAFASNAHLNEISI